LAVSLYLQTEKTTSTLFGTLSKEEKECILSIPLNYTFMKNDEKLAITERIAQHSGVQRKLLSNNNYAGGISIPDSNLKRTTGILISTVVSYMQLPIFSIS
jgi:hypothetical protein